MQFIIMLALILIAELTRPTPKPPKRPGINDFSVTTAEQDRRIPWIIGQPWLPGANLVWYGDLRTGKIQIKQKGLFTSKKVTVGYKYYIGFHLVFGRSSRWGATLLDIVVGTDKVWSGALGDGNGSISKPTIWGGDEAGGGIAGKFTWMPGLANQGQNAYLKSQLGATLPAFRGVFGLSWNQGYHGNSTQLPMWKIRARVLPQGLASGKHNINGEANPAEAQYELLTDSAIGLGLQATDVDVASFVACANTLYNEGMGMSMAWDNAKSVEEMLKEIDRHIDSITYQDPDSGLWRMRLIRNDYNLNTLPIADPSNANLLSFARPTADELVNELKVTYSSEELEGQTIPVQIQDPAAFQSKNRQKISSEIAYPGFTKKDIALKAATRDMRALSYGFARVQLKVSRALNLNPVDRFKLDWPPLGITNMPMIVMEKDIGTLASGEMTITAVQDVFGLGEALYTDTESSGWVSIDRSPAVPTNYRMEFTPYWLNLLDDTVEEPTSAVPMLMVEEPNSSHLGYEIEYSDPTTGGNYVSGDTAQAFTPTAVLAYDYLETAGADTGATLILKDLKTATSVQAATLSEMQNLGAGLVVIDSEILGFTAVTARADGSYAITGVQRGLLDSVIARHLAGAKAWLIYEALGRTQSEVFPFAAGTYAAKIMPVALGGTLDITLAPVISVATNGTSSNARPLYAYPVRNLAVNGVLGFSQPIASADLVLTWKHSNRLTETTIKLHSEVESVRETNAVYRAYLYNDSGTLLASSGDLTAATYTFTNSLVPANGYVQVESFLSVSGASARATAHFSKQLDYAATQDTPMQLLTAEAGAATYWRMTD